MGPSMSYECTTSNARARKRHSGIAIALLAVGLLAGGCDLLESGGDEVPSPTANAEQPEPTPPALAPETTGNAVPATYAPVDPTAVVPVPGAPSTFAELVQQVQPGVVYIYTSQVTRVRARNYWSPYGVPETRQSQSLGSGFLIDEDGYIMTNSHVIEGASEIQVVLHDGTEYPATLVGVDPATDLAVIRIEPTAPITALPFGNSDDVRVGDWVIAVGNPFGLSSTVTAGILSARGRRDVPLGGAIRYVDFLQTDASINPGNSGGPLLNMQGEVIGINTAINPEGQGIGFAIPVNMASTILPQLRENGTVSRSWLGIRIAEVDPDIAGAAGMPEPSGALVTQVVRGGPAEIAGLRPGDIILSFDGTAIEENDDLPWIASTAGVGARVDLEIARGASRDTVTVVMGAMPE